jgi:YidC/Oxa1 family membrane protein insertase
MEKRALLAVALSILILAAWQMLFVPRGRTPLPTEGVAPPVGAPPPRFAGPDVPDPDTAPVLPPTSEEIAGSERREFILDTSKYSIRFSNEGGRILSWRLKEYVDDLSAPHEIIPRTLDQVQEYPLRIGLVGDEEATVRLDSAIYQEEVAEPDRLDPWPGGDFDGKIVTFTYADGRGLSVTKRLAIPEDGYVGFAEAEVRRNERAQAFLMTWAVGLPQPQSDSTTVYFATQGQGVVRVGAKIERFAVKSVSAPIGVMGGTVGSELLWGGLESTYFASLLIPDRPDASAMSFVPIGPVNAEESGEEATLLAARFAGSGSARFTTVVGPKDYELLARIGHGLERVIDYSRFSLIYAITKYLFLALKWVYGFVGNYGFSIIILTVLIRSAFFPITYRSMITMRQNMKKMQKIQPRVKAIQERYRKMKRTMDSQKRMNDEIMGIYRKEGVNPMGSLGGCLPLLLQMPVFIGFYNLLSVSIEMRGAPFMLWIQDLSRMDPYYVFPVLMGLSWMVQQSMTSSSIPDPMQRRLMGAMPIIFTFMMARMPSGLVIYWFVQNLLGLLQQWLINRHADKVAVAAKA